MHFDREHSFLLQVKGVKHVSVAAFEDDPAALQREFDRYVDGRECDFAAMQAVAETFTIQPGVGVYLPSYVPHWVETEAGISISFSIPFDTEVRGAGRSRHRINKRMRRLHLSPRPIGASERVDKAKAAVVRSLTKLRGNHGIERASDDESVLRDWLSVLSRQKWIVLLAVTVVPLFAFAASQQSAAPVPGVGDGSAQRTEPTTAEALNLAARPPPRHPTGTRPRRPSWLAWEASQRWR